MTKRHSSYLGGGTIIGSASDRRVFGGRKGCLDAGELLWKAVRRYAEMEDWWNLGGPGFDNAVISYGVEVETGVKAQILSAGGLRRWMEQHPHYAQCLAQARKEFKARNPDA